MIEMPRIRLLDRHIFFALLMPFIYCIMLFVFFFIMYDLTCNFEDYIKMQVSVVSLIQYYYLSFPSILVHMMPIAVLLAVLYTIGIFTRYNEFNAMRFSGISYMRIIMPFFVFGFLIVLFLFFLNEKIVPHYQRKLAVIWQNQEDQESLQNTEIAFYNRKDMRDWIAHVSPEQHVFTGVHIRQFDTDGKIIQKIFAETARWLDKSWWFFNGRIFNFDEQNSLQGKVMEFKKIHMPYKENPDDFFQNQENMDYMNYRQLKGHIKIYPPNSKAYKAKLVDLYFRIAFPCISLVAIFFGVPIGLLLSKGGMLYGLGVSFGICLIFYVITTISLIIGKEGILPPLIAAWCANGIFTAAGIMLLRKICLL